MSPSKIYLSISKVGAYQVLYRLLQENFFLYPIIILLGQNDTRQKTSLIEGPCRLILPRSHSSPMIKESSRYHFRFSFSEKTWHVIIYAAGCRLRIRSNDLSTSSVSLISILHYYYYYIQIDPIRTGLFRKWSQSDFFSVRADIEIWFDPLPSLFRVFVRLKHRNPRCESFLLLLVWFDWIVITVFFFFLEIVW